LWLRPSSTSPTDRRFSYFVLAARIRTKTGRRFRAVRNFFLFVIDFLENKPVFIQGSLTWGGRLSAVDLLVISSLEQLIFTRKILFNCFYKSSYLN
jgi:hypothetical protein